jgi:rod shape-determining protein MreC
MARRARRTNPTYTFIALALISFVMMSFDLDRSTEDGIAGRFRSGAASLFGPVQRVADAVADPIFGFVDAMASLATLRQQNEFLQRDNDSLTTRIQDVTRLEAENEQLRLLLDVKDDLASEFGTLVADVQGIVDDAVILNKGTSDGVVVGNPVLNGSQLLIGRVTQATENQSTVTLLTRMVDAAQVTTPDGLVGLVRGGGRDDELRFEVVQEALVIPAGTTFTTAGGLFPRGFIVGSTLVDLLPNGDQIIGVITPAADFSRSLNFVIVLQYTDALEVVDDVPATTLPTDTVTTTEGG